MMEAYSKYKKAFITIGVLLIVSPIFGVILASAVGYREPLDVAAHVLRLHEVNLGDWTPFADYTVPGLPDTIGYIVAGAIGVAIILAIGLILSRMVSNESA
jgi:cobalt/nickel transport protein